MLLLEQRHLLRPLVELAVDDLADHLIGLALLARPRLEHGALGLAGLVGDLLGRHVDRRRWGAGDVDRDLARELLELFAAGHEVRLALDLDQHAHLAGRVDVGGDDALAGRPAAALGGRRLALDPQDLDRLLHVAAGLGEGGLAVHDPRRGPLPEHLDVGGGDAITHRRRVVQLRARINCSAPASWPAWVAADRLPRPPARRRPPPARPPCGRAPRPRRAGALPPRDGGGLLLGLALGLGLAPGLRGLVDGLADRADHQLAGADRVVVPRNRVVDRHRVDVRVDQADDRDSQPLGLAHRDRLGLQIDDQRRLRQALHPAHAAEVVLELRELGLARHALLGGQQVELALLPQGGQLVQALDPGRHRVEVGQQPAEPALVDVRHVRCARPTP